MNSADSWETKLTDAIQVVAEAARELSDGAEPIGSRGNYQVSGEDMKAVRYALRAWSAVGEAMIREQRAAACPGGAAHEGAGFCPLCQK